MITLLSKLLLAMLFIAITVNAQTETVWSGTADTTWYTSHKDDTEFTITTAEQLAGLARLVNGSETNGTYNMSGKTITLGADIMLNDTNGWQNWETTTPSYSWAAIGTSFENSFRGTFDGVGYTVSGVYINNTSNFQGLFGYIGSAVTDSTVTVNNVGVVASYIKGGSYVGGLVGVNISGTVSNSYSTGAVSGTNYVGGLVGNNNNINYGSVSNSYSAGVVSGNSYVGGLVGYSSGGIVSNSYSTGAVSGNSYVGGLVGDNSSTVSNSYSTGTVSGNSWVGGLVGENSLRTISNSYSTGAVSGTGNYVGGLVGNNGYGSTVRNSYYDKETSGRTDTGKGTGKTTAEMQSEEFVALLNAGASILSMNAWVYVAGKYPTLSNTPANAIDIASYFASGAGTEASPYIITTKGELECLSVFVNYGKSFSGQYFKLGNNIALNDTAGWQSWETTPPATSWTAIGTESSNNKRPFSGTFDGDEHIISGVYINNTNNYQGLFGYLDSSGTIKNVGVIASYIKGAHNVGDLVGRSYGTVSNSYSTGAVSGRNEVGGLVGLNFGTVSNSYSTGAVKDSNNVGGLVGSNYGTVSNSYSTGAVRGTNNVGGLVGENQAGGTVINSYSTGAVIGNSENVGGLVGKNYKGIVINSYSTGTVSKFNGNSESVGGLLGLNTEGSIISSYWNTETSGQSTSASGQGKTTAQIKTQSTFVGWDFVNTWGIDATINGGYPYLRTAYTGTKTVTSVAIKTQPKLSYKHGDTLNLSELVALLIYSDATIKEVAFADFATNSITTNLANSIELSYDIHNGNPIEVIFNNSSAIKASTNNLTVTEVQTPIISQIAAGKIKAQATANAIILQNLPSNSKVEVYNLKGSRIYLGNTGNLSTLDIGVQAKGMYIVKASFGSGKQVMRVAVR